MSTNRRYPPQRVPSHKGRKQGEVQQKLSQKAPRGVEVSFRLLESVHPSFTYQMRHLWLVHQFIIQI